MKNRLQLQFHITGKCNLYCKHCYRTDGDVEPLLYEDICKAVEQFVILKKQYNLENGIKKRGHINITGGEPFCRHDIIEILRFLKKQNKDLTYGILTNGSFITDEIIAVLKETEVSYVQLSLDGNRKIHDSLRAPNDFHRVIQIASKLEKNGIRTHISFTANKANMHCIPYVANVCRKHRITKLWSDRIVPIGNAKEMENLIITASDLPDYNKLLCRAQGNWIQKALFPKTTVSTNRALQFIGTDGAVYRCGAGKSLITIDEFGQIMPCRRMPIVCGDIFSDTLAKVYYDNAAMKKLRAPKIPKACLDCDYSFTCAGGAKCQGYAISGRFDTADPACPFKKSGEI